MDVVVSVLGDRPLVLLNRGAGNHWLTLKLVGTRSNRDGIGARIKAGDQVAYVTTAGSYLSARDGRAHFGLGSARQATVEILWPGGKKQVIENIAADRIVTVREEP